jgi:hypothetical protein
LDFIQCQHLLLIFLIIPSRKEFKGGLIEISSIGGNAYELSNTQWTVYDQQSYS